MNHLDADTERIIISYAVSVNAVRTDAEAAPVQPFDQLEAIWWLKEDYL